MSKVDGNLKRLEHGLTQQQRVLERTFWERSFLTVAENGPGKSVGAIADIADAMLREWSGRWGLGAVEKSQPDGSEKQSEAKP